jgi:hypothetical protein
VAARVASRLSAQPARFLIGAVLAGAALAACTSPGAGAVPASASPSGSPMMEHSPMASPSDAMMEHSPMASPSDAMMHESPSAQP